MIIDLAFIVLLTMAVIKGYTRGLVVAVFSLLAFIIGLAAALKLSALVAKWLGDNVNISEKWLPVASFALVFIGVVLLVRMGAKAIEKTMQFVLLGWVNKLGGILFFSVLYLMIGSVLLFYAEQLKWISPETIKASQTYPVLKPWAPEIINGLSFVFPFFQSLFTDLQQFFGNLAAKQAG
ncbi:MAG: CvpA family protein [Dinghuibacter sp.]|nr:CvpA family protein [Dinghuibacter sp.]